MANIAYFEVPADDVERAKKFYSEVLGWKINKPDMEDMPPDYNGIMMGKSKKNTLNMGGMYKRTKEMPPGMTSVAYAEVDDIDKTLAAAQKNGGKIVMPKMHIKDVGQVAQILDTEGNRIGVWQMGK